MDALETGTLAVPGASLYFEVRGSGPLLLLIPGGNSDAAVFERLAAALAACHRVVSYDPRGYSRSPLDGPPTDQRIEVHADDACRLLDHVAVADEPAQVFGSCSGGLVALELAMRHQGRVRSVVTHEPPAMGLLPDAAHHRAFFDDVHEVFRREGVAPALRMLEPLFGGRPAPVLPEAYDNSAFFLAHMVRPSTRFVPDLAALAAAADLIVVAGGRESRTHLIHQPALVLAERLGQELAEFPGGHVGYAKYPVEFAGRLVDVLAGTPATNAYAQRHRGSGPCAS
ncbi:alpha/beta fold hydrolase [Streptomyces sp. NPDC053079]|uniref:alpha/beta fold hydrolase n=1 Tax=Streptomyces sp. NPDC053079 TaxID=3365697 RepID=UPI0037CCF7FC